METDNRAWRFDGLIAAEESERRKRLGSYHVSPALAVVAVTTKDDLVVPVCHGYLDRMAAVHKTARSRRRFLTVVRWSEGCNTSRCGNSRHLCPVVCLGYPLLPLHPLPRAFDHATPPLLSAV